MPGCWFREDGEMVWRNGDAGTFEVDRTENPIVDVLLGPKGEVLAAWREREPIGYDAKRWAKPKGKN